MVNLRIRKKGPQRLRGRNMHHTKVNIVPWKLYATTLAESLLCFGLATFSLAMYFTHSGINWIVTSLVLIILYLFILTVCIHRIIQRFSLAALILLIPIAPLVPLVFILILIPLLQSLQ